MDATGTQASSDVARLDPTPEEFLQIFENIAKQLAAECPSAGCGAPDCWIHNKGWKEAIFPAFAKRLTGPGVEAFFTVTSKNEFLLDFVLLECDRKIGERKVGKRTVAAREVGYPTNVRRTILGMEVEFGIEGISDAGSEKDFNKLLCFSAPLKVFIYWCAPASRTDFKRSIEVRLQCFDNHREGDQYLIIESYKPRPPTGPILWEKRQFRFENGTVHEIGSSPPNRLSRG